MHESKLFNNKREKERDGEGVRERRRKRRLKGKNCVSNKEVFISIQNCCCRDKQNSRLDIKSKGIFQSVTLKTKSIFFLTLEKCQITSLILDL